LHQLGIASVRAQISAPVPSLPRRYTLADFDYALPPELIAQIPARERTGSRLLHVDRERLVDRAFTELPSLFDADDLLIFNDTRVIHARLRGRKPTGGGVELLIERITGDDSAIAQLKSSHPPRPGGVIELAAGARAIVESRDERFFALRFERTGELNGWLEAHGEVPLPPYIAHRPEADDAERYQTVYARHRGAVAAPTAGLHFDQAMLDALARQGTQRAFVTLHVGAGTFQPVQTASLDEHRMHSEWYSVPDETADAIAAARARGGRIVAIGTTSLRALESAAALDGAVRAGSGETSLFITPGYRFRVVDRLLTNFHLPKSTLLMLVSAFAGYETIRGAYAHAVARRYRFMSYGDAMLLTRDAGR
jgi:S-adenosylmethionine:tRNA ribosyltransferase-isomerase